MAARRKLTDTDVLAIRAAYADGTALKDLALAYPQVSKANIHHIVHGNRHRGLLPEAQAQA